MVALQSSLIFPVGGVKGGGLEGGLEGVVLESV